MIVDIINLLKITEHFNISENIEIAKGKYERPTTLKKLIKQIKRWRQIKN